MLTNQLIGAAHNALTHAPRQTVEPDTAPPIVGPTNALAPSNDAMTTSAVRGVDDASGTATAREDRPPLEVPKRVEMFIALVDTVPDAVPESIYDAVAVREPEE